jgi:hypothetical protein
VSNQPEGNLVEHFQQHESTGRLAKWPRGNQMFVPQLTLTSAFRLELALSISTLLDNTFIFSGFILLCSFETGNAFCSSESGSLTQQD